MILKPYYNSDITLFAETNFRDQRKQFGIKRADRRNHMYLVGKSGMGKTSLIEHMIVQDMFSGQGVCVLDPSGALIEQSLHYVPESRIKDVIYFNPHDSGYPFAFNFLSEIGDEKDRHTIVNGLVSVFRDVWSDVWGPRFEYVLMNALLTLSHNKSYTILHLLPLFNDSAFRKRVVDEE